MLEILRRFCGRLYNNYHVDFLIHKMNAMMKHKTPIYQKIKPTLSTMESKGFRTSDKKNYVLCYCYATIKKEY